MTLEKKHIKYQKTLKIFTNNPIIMFYHYNNVNTNSWRLMKSECSKIGALETLVVKNRIARNFIEFTVKNSQKPFIKDIAKQSFALPLESKNSGERFSLQANNYFAKEKAMLALLQGNSFLIGCQSVHQLACVYKALNKFSNFIFIGSVIDSAFFNKKAANKQLILPSNHKAEKLHYSKSETKVSANATLEDVLSRQVNETFTEGFISKQINETILNSSKIYTHLDIEKLIQLDSSIYIELIKTLQSSASSLISVLNKPHYTIISLLNHRKNRLL